ncbi:hypothetical protein BX666DRAFT_2033877 [Dichotomocladium elegans]|nr:hypothetical protein BX666DRAFT_2033877 [Dichotomocladium elegans]
MSIVIGLTGVVTRDVKWLNFPRMVEGTLKDNITATFSVSAERAFFRVTTNLPRIHAFLQDNHIGDGSSLVVQGRLRVDTYLNQRGVRTQSLVITPTRIRLAHTVSISVANASERPTDPNITSERIAQRLRAANLLSNIQQSDLSVAESTVLRCLNDSIAVANIEAHPLELLRAIGKEFCERLVARDETLTPQVLLTKLPQGFTISQATTLLHDILVAPASLPSTRPTSSASSLEESNMEE